MQHHELGAAVRKLFFAHHRLRQAVRKELGLTPTEMNALDLLASSGPVNARALAEHCGISPSTTTHLLDRLSAAGRVELKRSTTDRRELQVTMSDQFRQEAERLEAQVTGPVHDVVSGRSEDERRAIGQFLLEVAQGFEAASAPRDVVAVKGA